MYFELVPQAYQYLSISHCFAKVPSFFLSKASAAHSALKAIKLYRSLRERPIFTSSFSCIVTCDVTHTSEDITFELVEDVLYGLHVRLQVLGGLRHSSQCCRQNRVQIELQYAVHGVAGKRGLRRDESTRVFMVSYNCRFLACALCLCTLSDYIWDTAIMGNDEFTLRRVNSETYFKRFLDGLV